ncbi:hypothetical protein F4774DRAFT_427226 [Daldinia eschscholtzii]|nr:hypothetical protein F4774DRAFT_427226 [Daldinia eschscholtzii]
MSQQLEQQPEQKQLWEINDVILNNNYRSQKTPDGTYYTLMTSRSDLPVGFSDFERNLSITKRETAEALALSSGRVAQDVRHAGGADDPNYQLPSHRIANARTIQQVISSGRQAKIARGQGEDKK